VIPKKLGGREGEREREIHAERERERYMLKERERGKPRGCDSKSIHLKSFYVEVAIFFTGCV